MNKKSEKDALPKYSDLFQPILDALNQLGGSAKPGEVNDLLAKQLSLTDELLNLTTKSGMSLFLSRLSWARLYLVKTGYLDASTRGVWSLTEKGRKARIDKGLSKAIVSEVVQDWRATRQPSTAEIGDDVEAIQEDLTQEIEPYRKRLLDILLSIDPASFERFCQRLLRESGFESVEVTGRTGDGGIDGNGVLQINTFVSFKVLFQCKRYHGSVTPSMVRDFRGAMLGRTDKGIILTTGTFTQEAKREANRDGVPPSS